MFFTTAAFALALPVFAVAQYGGGDYGGTSPATTSAAAAAPAIPSAPADSAGNVNIEVAPGGKFVYSPANVTATNGTVVNFYFPADGLAHSVTQTSFAKPCTALAADATANTTAGFDSGLQQGVQFSITIENDQIPIYFYCKQVTHCGSGMVGTINAPANGTETFDLYMAASQTAGKNIAPETDNGPVTGGVGGVASATPSNTASAAAQSTQASSASRLVASTVLGLLGAALSVVAFA